MVLIDKLQWDQQEYSRRSVIRKAAYTTPVVLAIAAAPNVALGQSGPRGPQGNNGIGNGGGDGVPGGSGGSNSPNTGDFVEDNR